MAISSQAGDKLVKSENKLKGMLLDMRRSLGKIPSPDSFDVNEYYHVEKEITKNSPQLTTKQVKVQAKEVMKIKRREIAQKFIFFLEDILEVYYVIDASISDFRRTSIPGLITTDVYIHLDLLKRDKERIMKDLTEYLKYWRWVYEKHRFPLFSRFNKRYPNTLIDEIIAEDTKLLEETWKIISIISAAHMHTIIRRDR